MMQVLENTFTPNCWPTIPAIPYTPPPLPPCDCCGQVYCSCACRWRPWPGYNPWTWYQPATITWFTNTVPTNMVPVKVVPQTGVLDSELL